MEICFEEKGLRVMTYGRDATPIKYKDKGLVLLSHDEIPFFYKAGNALGGLLLDLETSLQPTIKDVLSLALKNHRPEEFVCYFAPSLSFSNFPIERSIQRKLILQGYQAACKRTNEVDYLDLPLLNYLYLRELGIPAENIYLSPYDTFDMEGLYSKKRGDEEKNQNIAMMTNEK